MNISKAMLIHSATVQTVVRINADRVPVLSAPEELNHIWIDFTDSQNNGINGKQTADSGIFLFDCVNSEPKGFVPKIGMRLLWGKVNLTINSVKPCSGLKGLEHYECGVS